MSRQKSSSGHTRCRYLLPIFWMDERNHFWETDLYSEKTKQYFRDSVSTMFKNEKCLAQLQPKP